MLFKHQPVRRWILSLNRVCNVKEIKIYRSASIFCCIIKQAKTIPHKMWEVIDHFQYISNRIPHFSIYAVRELSYVYMNGKITIKY